MRGPQSELIVDTESCPGSRPVAGDDYRPATTRPLVTTSGLVSCPDGQPEPEDRSAASTRSGSRSGRAATPRQRPPWQDLARAWSNRCVASRRARRGCARVSSSIPGPRSATSTMTTARLAREVVLDVDRQLHLPADRAVAHGIGEQVGQRLVESDGADADRSLVDSSVRCGRPAHARPTRPPALPGRRAAAGRGVTPHRRAPLPAPRPGLTGRPLARRGRWRPAWHPRADQRVGSPTRRPRSSMSSCIRSAAMGVRRSCAAPAMKARSCLTPSSMRARSRLSVAASRPTSSSCGDVRQSSSQVMEADGIGLARQVADRRQGTASEPPPADQRSEGAQDPDHDQQLGEAGGAAVDSSQ